MGARLKIKIDAKDLIKKLPTKGLENFFNVCLEKPLDYLSNPDVKVLYNRITKELSLRNKIGKYNEPFKSN